MKNNQNTLEQNALEKNELEKQLYDKPIRRPTDHRFNKGMFISINNHKSGTDDIVSKLKKDYQSIIYGLTGKNISRETNAPTRSFIIKM